MTSSSQQSTTNQNSTVNQSAQSNQTGNTTGNTAQNGATSSQTNPWANALPTVNSILGTLNPLISSSGLNPTQQAAINQLTAQGQAGNPYASSIGNSATSLLNGGGAMNQQGTVNNAYQQYQNAMNPLASNTNYNPLQTPGIGAQLQGLQNNITNSIERQFAAGGRSFSPAESQALAYGLTQGMAPVLTNQYNQNVSNQQNAANNLYSGGINAANTLSGYNQNANINQLNGSTQANNALAANQWGANSVLNAQGLQQSIPTQQLAALSGIATPIAGLGSSSSGTTSNNVNNNTTSNMHGSSTGQSVGNMTGVTNTTSTPSLLQSITGLGGLFGGGANSAFGGMTNAASGLLSGLGSIFGL